MTVTIRTGVVAGCLLWLVDGVGAQPTSPIAIRQIEPTSLPRGQTTTVLVTGTGLPGITAALVTPPIGVRFVEVTRGPSGPDGSASIGIVLAVDAKAAPGERTLYVSSPGWDFELTKIRIQDHDVRIAALTPGFPEGAGPDMHGAPARLFSFNLFDDQDDVFAPDATVLGKVRATTRCGGKQADVTHGDMNLGVSGKASARAAATHESVPTQAVLIAKDAEKAGALPPPPRVLPGGQGQAPTVIADPDAGGMRVSFELPEWAGTGTCDLRVSVTDKAGNESNALRLTADLK